MRFIPAINEIVKDWNAFNSQKNYIHIKIENFLFYIPIGIKFKCIGCGNCCHTNNTPLKFADIQRINHYLINNRKLKFLVDKFQEFKGVSEDSHSGYYCRKIKSHKSLTFYGKVYDQKCIFLNHNNQCIIHPVKPLMCQKYPFEYLLPNQFLNFKYIHVGFMLEGTKGLEEVKRTYRVTGTESESTYVCQGFHSGQQNFVKLKKIVKILKEDMKTTGIEMKKVYTNPAELKNLVLTNLEKILHG